MSIIGLAWCLSSLLGRGPALAPWDSPHLASRDALPQLASSSTVLADDSDEVDGDDGDDDDSDPDLPYDPSDDDEDMDA